MTLSIHPFIRPSSFVSGAYLLYSLRCVDASWDGGVSHFIYRTYDLVFRIIVSEAYLILCIFGWWSVECLHWISVSLALIFDLVSRICIESGAYLLYSLGIPNMVYEYILT